MSEISVNLHDKIQSRVRNIKLGDADSQITLDPNDAVFFDFDFEVNGHQKGNVVINLIDDNSLELYFSSLVLEEMDQLEKNEWYTFVRDLRHFAHRNMVKFEMKNVNKRRLDRKDFELMVKTHHNPDGLSESKMFGSKKKSYQKLADAKIIVQHKKVVDEGKHGSRSRDISAIFIENSQGERFRFPENYLPGARAMARHVSYGGYLNDEKGKHIVSVMNEMLNLQTFVRKAKSGIYEGDDAANIIQTVREHYNELKSTLSRISNKRGYSKYFENLDPKELVISEEDIAGIKQTLTRSMFDNRIEGTLENVSRALKMKEMKEAVVAEGTWALPRTPDQMANLRALLQHPLEAGQSNQNASNALYDLIGDDDLFDSINNTFRDEDDDPTADVRFVVINWIAKFVKGHRDGDFKFEDDTGMIDGFIEILRDWKNKDNNQDEDPTDDIEQNPSVNEEAELAAIKALAGIGNESVNYAAVNMQPYMTPRSIVARRLRAEQDAARNK